MSESTYNDKIRELFNKNKQTSTATMSSEESTVREMRVQDSVESNFDPVDMPLEVAKSLSGAIDTELKQKKHERENPDDDLDNDTSKSFRP